jgi:hypothetical protein
MKGIHPNTCIHHIYFQGEVIPVRQPQRRMNPTLKDMVNEDIQKFLNVRFIYPISNNKCVGQLRGGVNQLLPCLNNYASFKIFTRHSMMITIMQRNKQRHIQHQSHISERQRQIIPKETHIG